MGWTRPGAPGLRTRTLGSPEDGAPRRRRPRSRAPLSGGRRSRGRAAARRARARVAVTFLAPRARGKRPLPAALGLIPTPPSGPRDHNSQRNPTGVFHSDAAVGLQLGRWRNFPFCPAFFTKTPPIGNSALTGGAGLGSVLTGSSDSRSECFVRSGHAYSSKTG